jgi:hypothetical protein
LPQIMHWLQHHAPRGSYGSPAALGAWPRVARRNCKFLFFVGGYDPCSMTKREREEDLKQQQAFDLALFRVRMRNKKTGVVMMFSQLLDETEKELQRDNQRLAARDRGAVPSVRGHESGTGQKPAGTSVRRRRN